MELKKDYQKILSLDEKDLNEENEESKLIDLIPYKDENFLKVEEKSINEELEKILFKSLGDRELIVIILRYGLAHEKPLTMQCIADLLHCSRQRINAINVTAFTKIKNYYDTGRVENFLKNATIRDYITNINDEDLRNIINNLNEYEKNLLAKRYNDNLTEIIGKDMTLEEFRYIFRVIVPKINYEISMLNGKVITLKR